MSFANLLLIYFGLLLLAVFLGGILPALRHWNSQKVPTLLSLSAGLMLGSAFIHLIPESIELIGLKAGPSILCGLLFLYFFEKFITVHLCETDSSCEVHQELGLSAFIGLFLHSLTDGIALGVSLAIPHLGFIVFIAIFLHKSMEAFSLTSILQHEHKSRSQMMLANFALLMAVPLGALFSFGLVSSHSPELAGMALAFSAGTFLHISLSDLLPEVHRHSSLKNQSMFFFIVGLVLMFLLEKFLKV